jgi:site-specific DNA-methyltransferase (adenine-specific)
MDKDVTNHLHTGDCAKLLDGMLAGPCRADLAFADPPYNVGYDYDVYDDNLEDQAYLAWTERWMAAVSRFLKPTGALWVAIGDEYAAEVKIIGTRLGLHLRNWVIWYYTFGVHCTQKFSRSHTHLLYFVKDPRSFTFNDAEVRVRSARQLVYNDRRADPRGRVPDNTWILRPQDAAPGFTAEHDTWYFARVAGTFKERAGFHSCQMPERLLERIIRCCSNPDDMVLDPFAGSGSTLVVAKKLGRRWLGCEMSADYVRHAGARIAAVRVGDPIEGPEDPLTSAPTTPMGRGSRRDRVDSAGLVEAFQKASDGYSIDRVIADPVLNAAFIDHCSRLGLAGRPRDWNLTLLGLRKTGKLADVAAKQRTQLSWESMDPFEFASEIALRRLLDLGYPSLDHLLCDPVAAVRFDDLARSLAPGFGSMQYRWAALRLRKDARLWRESALRFKAQADACDGRSVAFDDEVLAEVRPVPAVYLLADRREASQVVYVGQTANLSERMRRMIRARSALDLLVPGSGKWQLTLFDLGGDGLAKRRGLQSLWIGRDRPRLNYLELGKSPEEIEPQRHRDTEKTGGEPG